MSILTICAYIGLGLLTVCGLILAVAKIMELISEIGSRSRRSSSGPAPAPAPAPRPAPAPAPRPAVPASSPMAHATEETGPMIYYANVPRGRRASDKEFRFNYRKVGGSWRAYIVRMPSLGGRSDGLAATHRHIDNGHYYICWDTPVSTLQDMQNISRAWGDGILKYILTGERFG